MIYFISDSHITFMAGDSVSFVPEYPEYHEDVGRIRTFKVCGTAYWAPKLKEKILTIMKNEGVKPEDLVVFTWGEVDCRWFATKALDEGKDPYKDSLDITLERYEGFLAEMKSIHNNIAILLLFPQIFENLPPELGTTHGCEIRNEFIKYFNKKLEIICKNLNIIPLHLWEYIVNSGGEIDKTYYMIDQIHLGHKARRIIINQLKKGGYL